MLTPCPQVCRIVGSALQLQNVFEQTKRVYRLRIGIAQYSMSLNHHFAQQLLSSPKVLLSSIFIGVLCEHLQKESVAMVRLPGVWMIFGKFRRTLGQTSSTMMSLAVLGSLQYSVARAKVAAAMMV